MWGDGAAAEEAGEREDEKSEPSFDNGELRVSGYSGAVPNGRGEGDGAHQADAG